MKFEVLGVTDGNEVYSSGNFLFSLSEQAYIIFAISGRYFSLKTEGK
jgi:hypothetical protein